ncbi:MAG TPA: lamin tail domain-containing protein [Chitinophagales bacterium]|nr:lamin tail domain-containing protein [Chitinophagales bacterium]
MKHVILTLAFLTCTVAAHAQLLNGSVIVSEINFNSDTTRNAGDWFELYNTSASPVPLGGWTARDLSSSVYTFPAGTTLGANAHLVVVRSVPQFNAQHPGVSNFVGTLPFNLGNGGDQIRLYDASNTLMYQVTYDDTLDWSRGADGLGRTLELNAVADDPNLGSSWFDGCMFGSPGMAYQPCDPPLVISEINYNSDTLTDSDDWLELHNRSANAINIGGWKIKDSHDSNVYTIPTVTLPANGFLVVYKDQSQFESVYPWVTNKVGELSFSLSNAGEAIRLYNAQHKLEFSVRYNDRLPWDTLADGEGFTLELLDATGRINDGTNWFAGCFLGSPGTAYDPNCPTSVESISPFADALIVPSGDFNSYQVLLHQSVFRATYALFDLQGKLCDSGLLQQGANEISTVKLPAGVFILQLQSARGTASFKLLVD